MTEKRKNTVIIEPSTSESSISSEQLNTPSSSSSTTTSDVPTSTSTHVPTSTDVPTSPLDKSQLEDEFKKLDCNDENFFKSDCNKFLLKKELIERNTLLEKEDENQY